ncbi:MAG TPA: hypothetical protein VE527_00625, partial [Reyranella sp.]|nr:hypothetical protein [Reyranella sp.]
ADSSRTHHALSLIASRRRLLRDTPVIGRQSDLPVREFPFEFGDRRPRVGITPGQSNGVGRRHPLLNWMRALVRPHQRVAILDVRRPSFCGVLLRGYDNGEAGHHTHHQA